MNGHPSVCGPGQTAKPTALTMRRPYTWRVNAYTAATPAIGSSAMARCCRRCRAVSARREITTKASVSASGPVQIGHVRNAATPNNAKSAIASPAGVSLHTTTVHHIATAKSSDTACERKDCSMNEPAKKV